MAEIEDCIGDDCGGGSDLPWPIPTTPPEDPSDPNPWEPIIPGGSYEPCETCDPGENPDDDEQTCPLGQIDDGFGNCIDEENHIHVWAISLNHLSLLHKLINTFKFASSVWFTHPKSLGWNSKIPGLKYSC